MPLTIVSGPENAPLDPLLDRTVAILGFGNQGSAHALNLRDSGVEVLVVNRPNTASGERARSFGFTPMAAAEAVPAADLVVLAVPDEAQQEVWEEDVRPAIRADAVLGFLHGFNIRYELIRPPADLGVIMVAPKGPGRTLRERYESGTGIPCLFAVHQNGAGDARRAESIGLAWANGIGCARAAIVYTSFADETETDLFGEQAVLCGGLTALIRSAFETLVEAGYAPELAYMECCQEVKQIADLVYERGLAAMMESISNTAEFGAYRTGAVLIDADVRARMTALLADVREGRFARTLRDDYARGFPWFEQQRRESAGDPIEEAGAAVRAWMPWLEKR